MAHENRVVRKKPGSQRQEVIGNRRKLHNGELHNCIRHQIYSYGEQVKYVDTCSVHREVVKCRKIVYGKLEGNIQGQARAQT
jgi:hypothetical protein